MPDKTLAALTAATPATGGLLYGTQGGADRKFTVTATGAAMMEAASAIKLDELAAPTDVTTLDATTSVHGLMSKTDKVKLDGIASSADVTSATNIASVTHAATGKTTPVDADEMGLIDSAASNVLKKLTWANLKATLKTYFDTLYAGITHASRHKSGGADAIKLDELALPTDVTTLNASTSRHGLMPKLAGGSATYLRGDGAWATPPGTGGTSPIVRGIGTLQGYTSEATGPGTPPELVVYYMFVESYDFTFTLVTEAGNWAFVASPSDPEDGRIWVDNSTFTSTEEMIAGLEGGINGQLLDNITVSNEGAWLRINHGGEGASFSLSASGTGDGFSTEGGGSGYDAAPAAGLILESIIIHGVPGKFTKPLRVWLAGETPPNSDVEICLVVDGTYYPICDTIPNGTPLVEVLATTALGAGMITTQFDQWISGQLGGDLIARLTIDPGDGGEVRIYAIAEQSA